MNSGTGQQLWSSLPAVYRARDRDSGDLRNYLDATGVVLDLIRDLLEQRLADGLPDLSAEPGDGSDEARDPQAWLLPYLARLFDARLLSPYADGRRREVAQAIGWRKRKGTLRVVEEIAEAVGGINAEVQEGWRRVAVTPRLDGSELPYAIVDSRTPEQIPGFLNGRPDEGIATRPVLPVLACPAAGHQAHQLQTVDVRDPDWQWGHSHPRRILLFVPPPLGFFHLVQKKIDWTDALEGQGETFKATDDEGLTCLYGAGWYEADEDGIARERADPYTVLVEDDVVLSGAGDEPDAIRGIAFSGTVELQERDLVCERVAVRDFTARGTAAAPVQLTARSCLFDDLVGEEAEIQLEYCTVVVRAHLSRLQASDCLFVPNFEGGVLSDPEVCIRYSRVGSEMAGRMVRTTDDKPIFFELDCPATRVGIESGAFGSPGYGVLHPSTSEAIRFGSEDGGEMGAYHTLGHTLRDAAVLEKLTDFLPLGLQAVLIPDESLIEKPDESDEESEES